MGQEYQRMNREVKKQLKKTNSELDEKKNLLINHSKRKPEKCGMPCFTEMFDSYICILNEIKCNVSSLSLKRLQQR